jgi:hypothetical protein
LEILQASNVLLLLLFMFYYFITYESFCVNFLEK